MGIFVYHGSTVVIKRPDVALGRANLDFGKAFYVTRIKSQAESWARIVSSRNEEVPVLNIYELDEEAVKNGNYKLLTFNAYDKEWLDFIVGSRKGRKPWEGYDMIEGGVANDRVIDTVEGYMNGDFTARVAIGRLKYHKPQNQIAILNQLIIEKHLSWIAAETLNME